MKNEQQTFLQKLKNPKGWGLAITYIVTILSMAGAILILFVDYEGTALAAVAYALFGVAAISLSYSVYTLIIFAPRMKGAIIKWAEKYEFTHSLLRNYGFRTIVFTIGSFALSVAYGLYNGAIGIMAKSIWYGALAAYYIMLALLRGGVLTYHRKKRRGKAENDELAHAKVHRSCGILLLILNVALSAAIAQMIFSNEKFTYPGWTIYASAAYAFYKITMSVINLFKSRREGDLTVQAVRNVNLADAAVSILALQTALLGAFGTEGLDVSLFNTLTGSVVSLGTLALGVFMVVRAQKKINHLQRENYNGEQGI